MNESAKAAKAFLEYRDMLYTHGKRALALLTEDGNSQWTKPRPRLATLKEWSAEFNWQARCKEYDKEVADAEALILRTRQREANVRQAEEARELQLVAMNALHSLSADNKLGSIASVQLLKNSIEAERKALLLDDTKHLEVSGPNGSAIPLSVQIYYPEAESDEDGYEDIVE
jgi:hypothetical protein